MKHLLHFAKGLCIGASSWSNSLQQHQQLNPQKAGRQTAGWCCFNSSRGLCLFCHLGGMQIETDPMTLFDTYCYLESHPMCSAFTRSLTRLYSIASFLLLDTIWNRSLLQNTSHEIRKGLGCGPLVLSFEHILLGPRTKSLLAANGFWANPPQQQQFDRYKLKRLALIDFQASVTWDMHPYILIANCCTSDFWWLSMSLSLYLLVYKWQSIYSTLMPKSTLTILSTYSAWLALAVTVVFFRARLLPGRAGQFPLKHKSFLLPKVLFWSLSKPWFQTKWNCTYVM